MDGAFIADRNERRTFRRAVGRELGRELNEEEQKSLKKRHGELYLQYLPHPRPLPGAVELLKIFSIRKNSTCNRNIRRT